MCASKDLDGCALCVRVCVYVLNVRVYRYVCAHQTQANVQTTPLGFRVKDLGFRVNPHTQRNHFHEASERACPGRAHMLHQTYTHMLLFDTHAIPHGTTHIYTQRYPFDEASERASLGHLGYMGEHGRTTLERR